MGLIVLAISPIHRKRRCSPSQSKPLGVKRRQRSNKITDKEESGNGKDEEPDSEDEDQSDTSTRLPQFVPSARLVAVMIGNASHSTSVSLR